MTLYMSCFVIHFCVIFSVISAHHTPSAQIHSAQSISDAIANKSSLFNKPQVGVAPTVLNPPKVINHGKPNLAPKPPPPQLKLVASGNNNGLNAESNRKIVSRHQSMKSPRYFCNNSYHLSFHLTFAF